MTTINSQEDFLRALSENPQWREAVRAQILGEELLRLPARFDAFVERMDGFVAEMKDFVAEQKQINAELKGFVEEQKQINAELKASSKNKGESTTVWTGAWILSATTLRRSREATPAGPPSTKPQASYWV